MSFALRAGGMLGLRWFGGLEREHYDPRLCPVYKDRTVRQHYGVRREFNHGTTGIWWDDLRLTMHASGNPSTSTPWTNQDLRREDCAIVSVKSRRFTWDAPGELQPVSICCAFL